MSKLKKYTVVKGDTIYSVAYKYKIGVLNLIIYNDIRDYNNLEIGQVLNIPKYMYNGLYIKYRLQQLGYTKGTIERLYKMHKF